MLIIKIQNDGTGTNESANYRFQVMVNDSVIESGAIRNHDRREGWQKLVGMLLAESYFASRARPATDKEGE